MTSATPKPRAGEHTKGPWQINGGGASGFHHMGGDSYTLVSAANGEEICRTISNIPANETVEQVSARKDSANARRIVACVNACEGIDDPATEISEMRECVRLLGEEQNAAAERDLLREREKVLVAAIEAALAYCESEAIGTVQQEIADNERMRQTLRDALKHGR